MKIKKVISLLLAVIMGFSVLPVSVFGLSEGDVVVLYTNDVHIVPSMTMPFLRRIRHSLKVKGTRLLPSMREMQFRVRL